MKHKKHIIIYIILFAIFSTAYTFRKDDLFSFYKKELANVQITCAMQTSAPIKILLEQDENLQSLVDYLFAREYCQHFYVPQRTSKTCIVFYADYLNKIEDQKARQILSLEIIDSHTISITLWKSYLPAEKKQFFVTSSPIDIDYIYQLFS